MSTRVMTKKKRTARRARPGRPRRDRPVLPASYSVPKGDRGMTAWEGARAMLERARGYWLATIGAHGAPHVVQQWGAWVDGRLYWEGGRTTRWAKNLARDPRVAVTVERAGLAIMVEGRATFAKPEPSLARKIVAGYGAKPYLGYVPSPKNWSAHGLPALEPTKVFAWKYMDFVSSATRFTFSRAATAGAGRGTPRAARAGRKRSTGST